MSKEPEFFEALYKAPLLENNKIIPLSELRILFENINEWKNYDKNLYCPECTQARLTFVHPSKAIDHLRTVKGQNHSDNCVHFLPVANKTAFNSFCDDNKNNDFIINRLNAILRKLYLNDALDFNPLVIRQNNDNSFSETDISTSDISNRNGVYTIPRKIISSPLSKSDMDIYKFYYGRGAIQWMKADNSFFLNIIYNSRQYCSLRVSKIVYDYIDTVFKENKSNVLLAFCTRLTCNEKNGRIYYNGVLRHSTHFVIMQ